MFKFINKIIQLVGSIQSTLGLAYTSSDAKARSKERHGIHTLRPDSENSNVLIITWKHSNVNIYSSLVLTFK